MQGNFIVTVDFGGTKILTALLDGDSRIVARAKFSTEVKQGKAAMMKTLVESIHAVLKEADVALENVRAVCVGVPGNVDPYTGIVGVAPNLGFTNFNIRREIEKSINVPVYIENDVNLAALGIKKFELKEKGRNVLVVFVGTGIGGALIFDGKLYRGSNYFAGEIGHITVQKNGPKCGCGKKGCFEAVASRTAIVREIKKDMKTRKSILSELVPKGKPIKSKALLQAIKKKDPVVTKQLDVAADVIGETIGDITNLLNLDMVVMGGGVVEALNKYLIPKIKESVKKTALKYAAKNVKITYTKLGDDAALLGGIALAEEFEGQKALETAE